MGENISTRVAYGRALAEFGADENIYVFDADLKKCTMTLYFSEKYPERFYNIGIAEANMVDVAAGFATCGATALVHTFAIFAAGRVYDQVRNNVCYPGLNVKVVGSHAGLTVGEDGATHQSLEDISLMRTIPGMTVIVPCDANETRLATKAMLDFQGPCYFRTGRPAVECVTDTIEDYSFEIGKGVQLKDGKDVTIIACGLMVQEALKAHKILEDEGISARVIDMHTIKPIDREIILKAAEETGAIVTAEEHNVIGGLGAAVAEVLVQNESVPTEFVGVQDTFGHSASPATLLKHYGLTPENIAAKAKKQSPENKSRKEMVEYMAESYVIGVDFGSDSVRALVVNTETGENIGQGVAYYSRWKAGLYQHPELSIFRQHPLDYLESLEECIKKALTDITEKQKNHIIGIGVDTTGSTPVPVDKDGTPLALLDEFSENENAMFFLWKDHAAAAEADEINRLFRNNSENDYTKYQGDYSAEWYWAKILYAVRNDASVREAAYTWEEHCDWITGVLCGETRPDKIYHSACAAGHKALWHSEWDGLPAASVLEKLNPYLVLVRERYGKAPQPSTEKVGTLSKEWTEKLGLKESIVISGSSFDAHAGAVGAGIAEKTFVCTMGTSCVDMFVEKAENLKGKNIQSYCGQAENSILPGYVGVETGQAAFGDIFAWFKRLLEWPLNQLSQIRESDISEELYIKVKDQILLMLQEEAERLPDEPFPVALDWFNGRRYPNTDDAQKSAIVGLSLGMDAPYLYRSLVFGAVCGLYRLIEGFEKQQINIEKIIAVGGISKKSPYVMQMLSDLSNREICILDSDQTCAQGAAMYAAVAAGIYENLETAAGYMAAKCIKTYKPNSEKKEWYRKHYQEYLNLAEAVNTLNVFE